MTRPYNFSAGPAMLPEAIMQTIKGEILDWRNGMSVMEMSHRSPEFTELAQESEKNLRELMSISDDYAVIFMQGGATGQFAAVPLNLLRGKNKADYVSTGIWSKKGVAEAKLYCDVNVVASGQDNGFTHIPEFSSWKLDKDAAYLHYTPNETVNGVEFSWVPEVDVPLVADMSSCILSQDYDVTKFDVIYAGTQKNLGPSGLAVVIVNKELLDKPAAQTPSILNYKEFAESGSVYNTPPTFAWYVCDLMFKWVKEQGGIAKMAEINKQKADLLYKTIDENDFYSSPVNKADRSRMNIPFLLADDALNKKFLAEAEERNLMQLAGHRSVGGMRASIYNAMPLEGVQALVDFMQDFARANG
jgi:phosphoserine aminotransferase